MTEAWPRGQPLPSDNPQAFAQKIPDLRPAGFPGESHHHFADRYPRLPETVRLHWSFQSYLPLPPRSSLVFPLTLRFWLPHSRQQGLPPLAARFPLLGR